MYEKSQQPLLLCVPDLYLYNVYYTTLESYVLVDMWLYSGEPGQSYCHFISQIAASLEGRSRLRGAPEAACRPPPLASGKDRGAPGRGAAALPASAPTGRAEAVR
jgi:hypothetical protein